MGELEVAGNIFYRYQAVVVFKIAIAIRLDTSLPLHCLSLEPVYIYALAMCHRAANLMINTEPIQSCNNSNKGTPHFTFVFPATASSSHNLWVSVA